MGDRNWQGGTSFGCQNWSGGTVFGGGPFLVADRFWRRTDFFVTGQFVPQDYYIISELDTLKMAFGNG